MLYKTPRSLIVVLCLVLIPFCCCGISATTSAARAEADPLAAVDHALLSGDRKLAMELLEPLVNGAEKHNPIAQFEYGSLLRQQRRYEEAKVHFRLVLELDPTRHWMAEGAQRGLAEIDRIEKTAGRIAPSKTKGGRIGYIGLFFERATIVRVLPGSPAEQANLAVGDRILSYDSRSVGKLTDSELSKAMHGLEGTPITLTIARHGKQFRCTITRGAAIEQDDQGPSFVQPVPRQKP